MGKANLDQGILSGLKAAFIFLPAFMILRYSILLSLFFAAIGGLSVGFILSWWQSKEPAQPKHNPFKIKKVNFKKRYPGLYDIPTQASRRGSLHQKKKAPEE